MRQVGRNVSARGIPDAVFERILVVCVGNICRSPMAECLLRQRLAGQRVEIASAGLAALLDRPIDPLASAVLAEHGIDAGTHRARQVTREILTDAGLILAMERGHLARAGQLAPEAVGKMFLLDKWVASRDIPDPYGQRRGMFERVYTMVEQAVEAWLPYLK